LQGNNIVNLKENLNLAYEMGKIIARLHYAFKEIENQDEFWDNSLLVEMKGWIQDVLQKDEWRLVDEKRFNAVVKGLEIWYDRLPMQLIHRDVHFGNFLFHDREFSGYIDFDLSQRNIRVFDLCYFMLGLLCEEEKTDISTEEWFIILKNLIDGYQTVTILTTEEKQAIPYVMMAIELLFVAWFIGEKDIKCAENAKEIFEFVESNANKILKVVCN